MEDISALDLLNNFLFLFTESAPFLLFGLFLAGVIHMIVPSAWVERTLGKGSSVFTAAVIGAPIPLCSCSVIPTAIGIRRSGASKASTASFMVATPETGVDSVGVTYALMGPVMAVIRPVSAIIAAVFTGTLVRLWDKEEASPAQGKSKPASSCCSTKAASTEVAPSACCSSATHSDSLKTTSSCSSAQAEPQSSSCCSDKQPKPQHQASACCSSVSKSSQSKAYSKLIEAGKYGFGKLLGDFMKWLLIGLFFAALIKTYVPESFLASHGSGVFAMGVMVLVSVPMYICATASTPIAAGLMLSGISPGAALVFMMAGPATNIATIMVVRNELGMRSVLAYLVGVIGSAIAIGLLTDLTLNSLGITIAVTAGEHGEVLSALYSASAIILAALILWNVYTRYLAKP